MVLVAPYYRDQVADEEALAEKSELQSRKDMSNVPLAALSANDDDFVDEEGDGAEELPGLKSGPMPSNGKAKTAEGTFSDRHVNYVESVLNCRYRMAILISY